jgi:hypothetical protein
LFVQEVVSALCVFRAFGAGTSGIEKFRESIYKIDDFQTRLGSTAVLNNE